MPLYSSQDIPNLSVSLSKDPIEEARSDNIVIQEMIPTSAITMVETPTTINDDRQLVVNIEDT